jgi:competence protein ComEC
MWPRLRTPAVLAGAVATALLLVTPSEAIPTPGAVVLDVGQGDAILISGGDGHYALVDGGPDPVRLYTGLRRYGIRQLDLVVLTHVHADHAGGLVGLVGRVSIGRVWADPEPHETAASDQLLQLLDSAAVQVERPLVGQEWDLGRLHLTVEGPLRRYASPNDQSIVVMIDGAKRSMLLSGDIEAIAQSELGHLRADVLKVPHHGAATSSLEWLDGVGSDLAVIPVGPNDFGHPSELVIEALEMSGDSVLRTDVEGDVLVPLG